MARDKDRTNTSEDRIVALCPRAVAVLKCQLALRERWRGSRRSNRRCSAHRRFGTSKAPAPRALRKH